MVEFPNCPALHDTVGPYLNGTVVTKPSDLLSHVSIEGQLAREALLATKTLLIVSCGCDINKLAYFRVLHNKGVKVVVVESPGNVLAERLESEQLATYIQLELDNREGLVDEIVLIAREVKADGCTTYWDDAIALAARVQEGMGFDGTPSWVFDVCHDKGATRKKLEELGLACPRNVIVRDAADLRDRIKRGDINFPCILKPVQGAASIAVYKNNSVSELLRNYETAMCLLKQTYVDADLMGLTFPDAARHGAAGIPLDLTNFIVEDFVDGPEVDVDVVVSDGKVVYININDDWPYIEPFMVERGVNYPTGLVKDAQEIQDAAEQLIKAFCIKQGVLHMEFKVDSTLGVCLIEINARVGGGPCHYFHNLIYGVDLVIEHAMTHLGIGSAPLAKSPTGIGIGLLLYNERGGTVREDLEKSQLVEEILKQKYVVNCEMFNRKGDVVKGWTDGGYPTHVGNLMIFVPREAKLSIKEAIAYAETLRSSCEIRF